MGDEYGIRKRLYYEIGKGNGKINGLYGLLIKLAVNEYQLILTKRNVSC